MFELADAASCMPCQDEALKERSSMPPVSVTMQPRNLPLVDAELDEDDVELDLDGELVAEPQAASSAAAPTAATTLNVALTEPPRSRQPALRNGTCDVTCRP